MDAVKAFTDESAKEMKETIDKIAETSEAIKTVEETEPVKCKVSFLEYENVLKKLPLSYYVGRPINAFLEEHAETSYYDPIADEITISYDVMKDAFQKLLIFLCGKQAQRHQPAAAQKRQKHPQIAAGGFQPRLPGQLLLCRGKGNFSAVYAQQHQPRNAQTNQSKGVEHIQQDPSRRLHCRFQIQHPVRTYGQMLQKRRRNNAAQKIDHHMQADAVAQPAGFHIDIAEHQSQGKGIEKLREIAMEQAKEHS